MKRIVGLIVATILVFAASSSAAIVLTKHEARIATKIAVQPVADLMSADHGSGATVTVRACRTFGRRGVCRVTIAGSSTCAARSHVLELKEDYVVWIDRLVCR